jgi:radical SAM protein (TIGR01212 family)
MDEQKLDLLRQISRSHHVVVEYGIESVYNKTLERVNRCHTWEETVAAIQMTAAAGILVGGHLIFGLPGETKEEMLQSAIVLSALPLHALKFHQLQVFRGTAMENEFHQHPSAFEVFTEEGYLNFMASFIQYLNPAIVIERIAGETPPRYAVSKPWGPRYDQLLVKFEKILAERNIWQGKLWKR